MGYATIRDVEEKHMIPYVDLGTLDVDAAMSESKVGYEWSSSVIELGKKQSEIKSLINLPRYVVNAVYAYMLTAYRPWDSYVHT